MQRTVKVENELHDLQELPPHVAEDSGGHLRAIHDYHVGSSDAYSEEADCEPDFEDDHFLSSYKNDARITKDGIYIDPKTFVPPFSCPIEGCEWRGSYRASRSQHIRSVHPDYVPPKKKAPIRGDILSDRRHSQRLYPAVRRTAVANRKHHNVAAWQAATAADGVYYHQVFTTIGVYEYDASTAGWSPKDAHLMRFRKTSPRL
ncbi:unnamed protein product [Heligmosomoides polygyrus]|uniref:Uncharacterized protein n=1 Tax=Heligmosomoides polygyrus TaxID=6339 RepID=A0A3P8F759_HELPZ|nr:unnamed protein product [Heligmosomoides polygyrus]